MKRGYPVQRLLGILGGILVILVLVSTGVSVVHKQADLYTTGPARKGHVDSSDPITTVSALPAECRHFARTLAAGQNISFEEYRIKLWPITVRLRQTPQNGWMLSDRNCTTALWSITHLQADNQFYHVNGHYRRSNLHQKPSFGQVQLLGALLGVGLLFYGFKDIRPNNTE